MVARCRQVDGISVRGTPERRSHAGRFRSPVPFQLDRTDRLQGVPGTEREASLLPLQFAPTICLAHELVLKSRNLWGSCFGARHPAWREPRVTRRVGGSRHLQPYGQGSFGQAKPCERAALLPVSGRSALVSSLLAFVAGWSALAAATDRSAFSSGVAPASPVTTAAPRANATAPANILETDIFTHPPSPGSLPGGCWVISRRGAAKGSHCQRWPYVFEDTRLFHT